MMKNKSGHALAVGITGGIGSGKTAAVTIFKQLGAKVYFADEIAKEIIDSNLTVRKKIQLAFGEHIYGKTDELDRGKMAKQVFENRLLKNRLDGIVHPYVLKFLEDEITKAKSSKEKQILFIEAALIYEAHSENLFDYVVVVEAERKQVIERVMKRNNLTRDEVLMRINSQMTVNDKIARADFIIHNNHSLASLKRNCKFLFDLFTRLTLS